MRAGKACITAALVALACAASAGAAEPEWYPVSNAAEGSFTAEFFVDTRTIRRKGDIVEFIERSEFTGHSNGWKQVIAQTLVDCRKNLNRTVRMKVTRHDGSTRVFDQSKVSKWTAIYGGTNAGYMRDFVCKK